MTSPTPILLDTFTDTDSTALSAHTGDSANTWTANAINTNTPLSIAGNQLTITNLNGGYTTGPSTTDVTAMFDNSPQSSPIGTGPVLGGAANLANGSYVGTALTGNWNIFRAAAGTFTSVASGAVGTEFPTANTAGDIWTLRLIRRTIAGVAHIGLIVNGRQVLTYADSSPLTGPAGIYNNNHGTGTADNFRIFHATSEVGIALIGDSITFGAFITTPPDAYYGAAVTRGKNGLPAIVYNHGISGTTTSDWVNSTNGASLSSAISDLQNQNIRVASIMLGVNDCKTATRISIANHKSNIAAICTALNAAGITAVLNRPTYVSSGAFTNTWDAAASVTYLPGYWEAQLSLINGRSILLGDTQGFDMIASDPTNRTGDGVHPVQSFSKVLFQMHAAALLNQFATGSTASLYINQNVDGGLL
jgi:lysophospholipase L1-like esterase